MTISVKEKGLPQYYGRLRTGTDLLDSLSPHQHSSVRVLLLGGDLKHLLSSLQSQNIKGIDEIEFVIADSNWELQAKNAFLINLLKRTDELESWIVKSFTQIYYSLELEEDVYALYFKVLREIIEDSNEDPRYKILWKEWRKQGWSLKFGERIRNSRVEKTNNFFSILKEPIHISNLRENEKKMIKGWYENGFFYSKTHLVKRVNPTVTCLNPIHCDFKPITPRTYKEEIQWIFPHYLEDRLVYAPHPIDSPFQDWNPCLIKSEMNKEQLELNDFISYVEKLVLNTRRLLLSSKLKITLCNIPYLSEIKSLSDYFEKESFNVIDSCLMADIRGTYTTLSLCYPLLRHQSKDSKMYTHHRIWQIGSKRHGLSFKSHVESELGIEAIVKNKQDFSNMISPPCQALTMPDNYLRTLNWKITNSSREKLTTSLSERVFKCHICGSYVEPLSCTSEEDESENQGTTEVSWSSPYPSEGSVYSSSDSTSSDTETLCNYKEYSPKISDVPSTPASLTEPHQQHHWQLESKFENLTKENNNCTRKGSTSSNRSRSRSCSDGNEDIVISPTLVNENKKESSICDEIKISSQNYSSHDKEASLVDKNRQNIKLIKGNLVNIYVKAWNAKIKKDFLKQPVTSNFTADKEFFNSLSDIRTSLRDETCRRNTLRKSWSTETIISSPRQDWDINSSLPSRVVKNVVHNINMSHSFPEEDFSLIVEHSKKSSPKGGERRVPRKSSLLNISDPTKRKRSVTFESKDILIHERSKKEDGPESSIEEDEDQELDDILIPRLSVRHDSEGQEELPEDYRPPTPPGKSHMVHFPKTPPSTPND
uniref:DUF4470 domain-containing protein n=1 Tax=Lepeophtheirus salmonis TaxID=72036 RepID=A0A0K2UGK2_LEPSM